MRKPSEIIALQRLRVELLLHLGVNRAESLFVALCVCQFFNEEVRIIVVLGEHSVFKEEGLSGLVLSSFVLVEQLHDVAEFTHEFFPLHCIVSLLQVAQQECELPIKGLDVSCMVIKLSLFVLLKEVALLFVALRVADASLQVLVLPDEVKWLLREDVSLEVL